MQNLKNIVVKIWPFSRMQQKLNCLADKLIVYESKLNDYKLLMESDVKEKKILLDEKEALKSHLDNSNKLLESKVLENNDLLNEISAYKKDYEQNLIYVQELLNKNNILSEDIAFLNNKSQQLEVTLKSLRLQFNINEPDSLQNSSQFWNNHYEQGGNSGTGSYNKLAEFKADTINSFIQRKKVNTVIELGCGDGNQLSLIDYKFYTGIDVSEYIVNQNKKHYSSKENYNFFCSLTEREKYIYEKFDLSISMDVIFHLLENDVYEKYMYDLFNLSSKYVIIYSSNHEEFTPWPEYRHRNFLYFFQINFKEKGWELMEFVPNKYPYIIGKEEETSSADFYIFQKTV